MNWVEIESVKGKREREREVRGCKSVDLVWCLRPREADFGGRRRGRRGRRGR